MRVIKKNIFLLAVSSNISKPILIVSLSVNCWGCASLVKYPFWLCPCQFTNGTVCRTIKTTFMIVSLLLNCWDSVMHYLNTYFDSTLVSWLWGQCVELSNTYFDSVLVSWLTAGVPLTAAIGAGAGYPANNKIGMFTLHRTVVMCM